MLSFDEETLEDEIEDGDEDQDEGSVGHLDRVRKNLKNFADPAVHPGSLKCP